KKFKNPDLKLLPAPSKQHGYNPLISKRLLSRARVYGKVSRRNLYRHSVLSHFKLFLLMANYSDLLSIFKKRFYIL
ncbi:MAG: hypothetical protein AAFY17_10465, partial [Cyanobacteria bacterium J06642_11]